MSINCLGMRGEKLGRFNASSLAPPQRVQKFFKPAIRKYCTCHNMNYSVVYTVVTIVCHGGCGG